MKKTTWHSFAKSHYLVNRIYDMLDYYNFFDNEFWNNKDIEFYIKKNMKDVTFIETLLKFFEKKLRKNKKNTELRINLTDLIYDLNTFKQHLCKDKEKRT